MIQVRNLDLQKERKSIRERINEAKIKSLIFLFSIDLTDNSLSREIITRKCLVIIAKDK